MNQILKYAYDPACFNSDNGEINRYTFCAAALGQSGDIGIISALGEGKDSQSSYGFIAGDILAGDATKVVCQSKEYELDELRDLDKSNSSYPAVGASRTVAWVRDHDWDKLEKVAIANDKVYGKLGRRSEDFPFNRFCHGYDLLQDEYEPSIMMVGNVAFWPSIAGAFYKKWYWQDYKWRQHDDSCPIWRDYVYRGIYAAAHELIGYKTEQRTNNHKVRRIILVQSRRNEFSSKMNPTYYPDDKPKYFKEGYFLMTALDAIKDAALEEGVSVEVMFEWTYDIKAIMWALSNQINAGFSEHRPFDIRIRNYTQGVTQIMFADKILDPLNQTIITPNSKFDFKYDINQYEKLKWESEPWAVLKSGKIR